MKLWIIPFLVVGLALAADRATASSYVVLCHKPDVNFKTIVVHKIALRAHLLHGDLRGACEIPAKKRCDDGDPCTVEAYIPGTALCDPDPELLSCDDGLLCTHDVCDSDRGCVSTVMCGPGTPVCDPAATNMDEACIGAPGECPIELIAAADAWELQPLKEVACISEVTRTGFGALTVRETRESGQIEIKGSLDVGIYKSGTASEERFYDFVVQKNGPDDVPCLDLLASPSSAEACLGGLCTDPDW